MRMVLISAIFFLTSAVACGSASKTPRKDGSSPEAPKGEEDDSDDTADSHNKASGGKTTSNKPQDKDNSPPSASQIMLVMGAIGDSISRGLNATKLLNEDLSVNWSTGDAVESTLGSHLARWKSELGMAPQRVENVAVSGATSEGLDEQLTKLVPAQPSYVTILIGANDLCQWSGEAENELLAYESRVEDALSRLIAANSRVRIVLSSVPDVTKIYTLKREESVCRTIWSFTQLCPELLGSKSTDEQRQAFRKRWTAMNAGLQDIAARHQEHVRFAARVATADFSHEDVAKDCFHPSPSGQQRIAELTWDAAFARQVFEDRDE